MNPRHDEPGAGGSARTGTVLLVEDEEALRELVALILSHQGFTVLSAANADEAFCLFDEHPTIDLLLTDVVMPGLSGPELSRQLVARRPTLRVLFMSGSAKDVVARHGILNPGIALLNKPFTGEELLRRVRDVLDASDGEVRQSGEHALV